MLKFNSNLNFTKTMHDQPELNDHLEAEVEVDSSRFLNAEHEATVTEHSHSVHHE